MPSSQGSSRVQAEVYVGSTEMIAVTAVLIGTAVKPVCARKTMREPDGSGE